METKVSTQGSGSNGVEKVNIPPIKIYIHWILLIAILLFAAFLRLYRISDYMTFLGDEGRDVLIVKHLLEGDLIGLGPTASVGGFFTGPIYYYFMAPFLWLFRLDPVGPAIMVGLFGIATVFLVYLVGKTFFNVKAGLFAAALYAVAPLVIAHSRSSWNPNPLPFFSLLAIFFVYQGVGKRALKFTFIAGILLGIALQLHYIATFLAVIIAVYIFFARSHLAQGETFINALKRLIKNYVAAFFGFLAGYSPFLAFEATHGFPNIRTVMQFMFGGTGETGYTGDKFTAIIYDVFFRLFGRLITRFPPPEQITVGKDILLVDSYGFSISVPLGFLYIVTMVLALGSISLLLYRMFRALREKSESAQIYLLILIWIVVGVGLFGFYRKPIYDYYFGFMFPLPFLLVGMLLSTLYMRVKQGWLSILGKTLVVAVFLALLLLNLDGRPMRYPPNRQLTQVRQISKFVLEKAQSQPFNFALITQGNSDHAYRYFFEIDGNPPVTIENVEKDPQRRTVTDQLLLICEDPNCKPLGHPLWEVAGFGRAEIAGEWNISVVKVFKLVHYKGEQ